MASLGMGLSLTVDLPARAFGFETTPPYVRHDRMANVADAPGAANNETRCIKPAGILCLEPQPWLNDQALSQYTFPNISLGVPSNQNWTTGTDPTTQKKHLTLSDATPDTPFNAMTLEVFPANSSFYVVLNRDDPGTGATLDAQHCYTEIMVGANAAVPGLDSDGNVDYSAGVPVRLVFQLGRPPFLQYATVVSGAWAFSPNFGENGVVAQDAGMVTEQLLAVDNRCLFTEWMPLPDQNMLVVSIRGLDDPLVLKFSQTLGYPFQTAAGNLQVAGMNGTVGLAIFPMRYAPTGTFTSSQIQLPFAYPGNGFCRLYGASNPNDSTLEWALSTDYTGMNLYYEIAMDASDSIDASGLATVSPIVQQVGVYVPSTSNYSSFTGAYQDLSSQVSEIEEEQWFDSERLAIRTQVGVKLTNWDGRFSGATAGIHLAASLSRWLTVQDEYGVMQPYSAPVQFITGWTGFKTSVWRADPARVFDIIIEDGLYPLERKQVGSPGFFDGWCALRAVGFLAELAGRTDQFIDPLLLQCDCGPNPEGCPHFKLPLGTGDSPKMGFHPEMTFLDAICQICQYIYGVVFADAYNILRVIPYYPTVYNAPFLGTFTDSGVGDGDPTNDAFLSQMWNGLKMDVDTSDRRTGILFGGLDPATNEVQATYLNADDYFGVPGLVELIHGFNDPLVVISDRFVDPVFTANYAANALQKMFRPVITTQNCAAFLPGMGALCRYNIQETGYAIDGTLALSCERVSSKWSAIDPSVFGSTVSGRSIYNV